MCGTLLPQGFTHTKIHNSQFSHNIATAKEGGAVVIKSKKIEFHNCYFEENISPDGKGGAINIISLASLMVNHTNFTAYSGNDGGAMNIDNTHKVVVWDCYFTSNVAKGKGGAILMTKNYSELNLYAYNKFINNSAKHGGALAFNANDWF